MGCDVFANGMEVSCKKSDGKVIAAMPDVCLSPPSPPAGPVPIPYPVSSAASDVSGGSKTVKVAGKETMLKDKSYFKKCSGDEAATKSLGQGVVTHTLGGKVYFIAWSMDVEFEGENVVRHLDMTTSNHASPMGNESAPWVQIAAMAFGPGGACEGMDELKLRPYQPPCEDKNGQQQTGHHLIPGRCMRNCVAGYNHAKAPVICVSRGNQHQGSHRACHEIFDPIEQSFADAVPPKTFTYAHAREAAARSAGGAVGRDFQPPKDGSPDNGAKARGCIAFQLDAYCKRSNEGPGVNDNTPLDATGAQGKVTLASGSAVPNLGF